MESARQIRHLLALTRYRSFRQAAEHLNISQSTLSESIKRVEDLYGVALFERGKGGITPTAYGEIVLDAARRIESVLDKARRDVDMLANFRTGHLVVGCTSYVAEPFVAPVIGQMTKSYPGLRFTLKVGTFDELLPRLTGGAIDAVFGLGPDQAPTGVELTDHTLPPALLYCRAGHPFLAADDPAAYFRDHEIKVIGPSVPEQVLRAAEVIQSPLWAQKDLRSLISLSSEDTAANAVIVRDSDVFSMHYRSSLKRYLDAGEIVLVPADRTSPIPELPAVLAVPADRPKSPALMIFVEMLERQIDAAWDEERAEALRASQSEKPIKMPKSS